MSKLFHCIVADCPWSFGDVIDMIDTPRGAQANYSTMAISRLRELPVKNLIHPDGSILCLWVPGSMLQDGLDLMNAWGFRQTQVFVWSKTKIEPIGQLRKLFTASVKTLLKSGNADSSNILPDIKTLLSDAISKFDLTGLLSFGMGRLFRQSHEICLIGISSSKVYKLLQNKSQRSVCFAENLSHSTKPEALQDSLDLMFPGAEKIELFARRVRPGWTCLGNEVCGGEDIFDSLAKL